jgi:hypothetical protein
MEVAMSAPMPGIGHNSGDDAQARKEFVAAQIVLWVGNLRLDQALKAEELGQVSGLQKALLLRNGHIVAAVRHCRLNPKADSRMSIYTLITYLADNNNGICHLSVTRMCKILKRSREAIVNGINSLEEDGQIGVNRSSGMPSCYWPLIPAALADLSANPVWFVDGLSDKPKARVFSTPEGGIAATKGDQSTLLDQSLEGNCDQSSPLDQPAEGNRSTLVDEPVNSSRGTGQLQPCSISLSISASHLKGQASQKKQMQPKHLNGQQAMAMGLGDEAAYAETNITISASGKLAIGEEFRQELRQAFTDTQIDGALNCTLAAMGTDRNKVRIAQQVRRQCTFKRDNEMKAAAVSKGQAPRRTFQR